jgi:hypothetical protein
MRRVPLILGLALILGLTLYNVYEFLVTNDGVRYFSSDPTRLAYAVLLGVLGGGSALGISRLSPAFRRRLKLLALAGLGGLLVGGGAFLGYLFCVLTPEQPSASPSRYWIAAGFTSMIVVSLFVWLEFRHVWTHPKGQRPTNRGSEPGPRLSLLL